MGLDAIIIGSGIGGMTTGVLMAKSGKKVLVLEQHDQAGGCCHTFIDKGIFFLKSWFMNHIKVYYIHFVDNFLQPTNFISYV